VKPNNPENNRNLPGISNVDDEAVAVEGEPGYTTNTKTKRPSFSLNLMEEVLSRSNLEMALARVQRNKGAAGVDGMTVDQLPGYLKRKWEAHRKELLEGSYVPLPVKRVEIPKPDGGMRKLGIPTVTDRFIQQALAQVLQREYDPTFSDSSFGFRPKRSAQDAISRALEIQREGYEYVVDIDLEKFFDRVNHDKLMNKLRRDIADKRVLKLIRSYLNAGVLDDGIVTHSEEGTPQGGPLSPLLSNIVLDDLDSELERRGHRFVRYADDCNIYVKTPRAGERVMKSVKEFIEKKLRLKVNEKKSKVAKPAERKFLGFSFWNWNGIRICVAPESIDRMKDRIRMITRPSRRVSFKDLMRELKIFLQGWRAYFAKAHLGYGMKGIDNWIRHRVRNFIWIQWKVCQTRYKKLVRFGVNRDLALRTAASGKGSWRLSRSPAMSFAFPSKYFDKFGLPRIYELS
jgi:RNA-directed DNA polymerase